MNLMGYAVLEEEQMPDFLKGKPRWFTCMAFTVALIMITSAAVSCGIVIGYTYCYVEHRVGGGPVAFHVRGNLTRPNNNKQDVAKMKMFQEVDTNGPNRTITNALASKIYTNIFMISSVFHDAISMLPENGTAKADNSTEAIEAVMM